MAVNKETLEALIEAQKYQAGSWAWVIEEARKYAQLKAFGTFTDNNGHAVLVNFSNLKDYEEMFKNNLLSSVMQAYREDANMGVALATSK